MNVAKLEALYLNEAIEGKQLDHDDVVRILSNRIVYQLKATFDFYKEYSKEVPLIRRSAIVEGIVSDFQRTGKMCTFIDSDSEEGAKIFRQLETVANPEMLMAEMSSEQLASFTNYQAKLEASFESLGWDI
ncbi:Annexin repeat [Dillenia turbinata]|uniref:Annexin repeat n=1 Tax=Dillenia turbinata TaxID=194707 RepID=A0AAN8V0P2_9MAGN